APGQRGATAIELVVEPVAEASDPLRQRQARSQCVGDEGERDLQAAAGQPGADGTPDDGAPDAQAALPDVEDLYPVLALVEVELRRRDHVVDPGADDAERHRPH